MRGASIPYSAAELAWLEANRGLPIADYARAFNARFGRDVSEQNLHGLRKRKGWRTGRTGRFSTGQASWNKGKPNPAARSNPKCRATQFKKGVRRGVAAAVYKPIGTTSMHASGYLQRKINDDLPLQARWRFVHLIDWEARNGPIPAGHALKCLDGDRTNIDPDNWELVPRGMLPRLNGKCGRDYDRSPAALKPTILAIAKLEHRAREVAR